MYSLLQSWELLHSLTQLQSFVIDETSSQRIASDCIGIYSDANGYWS